MRDEYLATAADAIYDALLAPDHLVTGHWPQPERVRFTCGLSQRSRSVRGQCYPRAASSDDTNEVFINPGIDDTIEVLTELAWQYARACRNGGSVDEMLIDIGIVSQSRQGQATVHHAATGSRAHGVITALAEVLGPYPHAKLSKGKADGTRQLKLSCNNCEAIWRMSRKWADNATACPCCASRNINS